ncbi:hypothetical protein [Sarcina ventriculi]|uniref:ImpA N-terminal domain-containing protein n=1 Tax=Sarcina ventriculi TaxID=1267 RepID=A0ABP2ANT4_SARVE|nr:hypothetical protein [Sarcina ventriculi]CUN74373.1 Uncharacterised protein [Sarcina ventriculi]
MDKKYVIDIRENNDSNDFVINIGDICNLNTLDLDINSCLANYKKALNKCDLEEASEILLILKELTEYGDKRFSDATILFKIKEILLFYKNMDCKNIIDSMNILLKIRGFFNFLSSQITFEYDDENTPLIEEIKAIRDNVKIEELLDKNLYQNYNPSIEDLEVIERFLKNFNYKNYEFLDDIYVFFEEKINRKIKNLNKCKFEDIKNIFKDKYDNNFYESSEFKSLLNENIISNYKEFSLLADRYYLIYRYNSLESYKEKRDILLNLLIGNLINVPKIYRGIIIENILENEKKYYEMNDFYEDVNKILEFIKKQNRLNAIIINT